MKVLLCCGGGFSSSAMTVKLRKEIAEKNLPMEVDFEQFLLSGDKAEGYDIVILCPHLTREVQKYNDECIHNRIPIYVIPPLQYGCVQADVLYSDCLNAIEQFKKNPQNPFAFPGEENVFQNKRRGAWIPE